MVCEAKSAAYLCPTTEELDGAILISKLESGKLIFVIKLSYLSYNLLIIWNLSSTETFPKLETLISSPVILNNLDLAGAPGITVRVTFCGTSLPSTKTVTLNGSFFSVHTNLISYWPGFSFWANE